MAARTISADFPFEHQFVTVKGSQMAYIDVGEGDPILFLHGNPTSSYLWRNIIPHLQNQGRCIAPDLIGMGRSDKPNIPYRFDDHYAYLESFIDALDLKNITLVIHDWGSGLGFNYAKHHPENIKAIAFMEAIVDTFSFADTPLPFAMIFRLFRTPVIGEFITQNLNFFVNGMLPMATDRKLTDAEMSYYRAPYPTVASRKPAMQWPREIPFDGTPADNHTTIAAYNQWLQATDIPKLLLHGEPGGLISPERAQWCKDNLPNLTTVKIPSGAHYVQEDCPHEIGEAISDWLQEINK